MNLGIGELIKPIQDSLAPVGGSLGEIWQGVVGDRIAAWRLKNAMALQASIFEQAKKSGVQIVTSKVPERYAFAWFEEATKQDEPEIQELFARLLLRASQGDAEASDRRHVVTLSQFTPLDARVFSRIYARKRKQEWPLGYTPPPPRWSMDVLAHDLVNELGQSAIHSLEHLINLGVVVRGFKIESNSFSSVSRWLDDNDVRSIANQALKDLSVKNEVVATNLGMSLYEAIKEVNPDQQS